MNRNIHKSNGGNKSGVALVIVLGLLALLMISSVTFAILMRVERAGAANMRHATVSRELLDGAIAYALADITDILSTNRPQWYDYNNPDNLTWKYIYDRAVKKPKNIWCDTIVSVDASNQRQTNEAHIVSSIAERYIQPGLAYRTYGTKLKDGAEKKIDSPEWIPVKSDKGTIFGRYAYVILNTTGLIDVNSMIYNTDYHISNPQKKRLYGFSPEEIVLPYKLFDEEFSSQRDIDNLFAKRDNKNGFQSFYDMIKNGNGGDRFKSNCKDFDVFSFASSNNTTKVEIGNKTADELKAQKNEIIQAFYDSGLRFSHDKVDHNPNSDQALWAYLGLLDYVDDDNLLAGENDDEILCRPCTEPLQLFSGAEALVTVIRTEVPKIVVEIDERTGEKTAKLEVDDTKYQYQLIVDGRAAYVWNFEDTMDESNVDSEIIREVKMTVCNQNEVNDEDDTNPRSPWNNLFKFQGRQVYMPEPKTVKYEQSLNRGKFLFEDEDREGEALHFVGDPVQISTDDIRETDTPDLVLSLHFAASLYKEDNRVRKYQRRFPIANDAYMCSNDDLRDSWMKVVFNTKDRGQEMTWKDCEIKYTVKNNSDATMAETSINLKQSIATKIVWVELFDPRFSCKRFEDYMVADNGHCRDGFDFFRPSVGTSGLDANQIPARDLSIFPVNVERSLTTNETQEYPEAINRKSKIESEVKENCELNSFETAANFDVAVRSVWDGTSGNCFFDGNGRSPLVCHILENPTEDTAKIDSIKSHFDGTRFGGRSSKPDSLDKQIRSFVKNDKIESVGELGFLPIGPWMTIRLYNYNPEDTTAENISGLDKSSFYPLVCIPGLDGKETDDFHGFHTVLDHFTVNNTSDNNRIGIDIDATDSDILAAPFCDMPYTLPFEKFKPAELEEKRVSKIYSDGTCDPDDARTIAEALENARDFTYDEYGVANSTIGHIFGNIYLSDNDQISDSLHCSDASDLLNNPPRDRQSCGEFEREALISNSHNLFGTGWQLYTLLIRAEAYSSIFGRNDVYSGQPHASKTALVKVARANNSSGYTTTSRDEQGRYQNETHDYCPFKVLSVKIIDE